MTTYNVFPIFTHQSLIKVVELVDDVELHHGFIRGMPSVGDIVELYPHLKRFKVYEVCMGGIENYVMVQEVE